MGFMFALPVWAQAEPVRIVYQAGHECPDVMRFVREIEERTTKARSAASDEPARTFDLEVTSEEGGSHGVLRITGVDGSVSEREVEGQSCSEVVSAAAFMIALAVDPAAPPAVPASSDAPNVASEPPVPPVPTPPPTIEPSPSPKGPGPEGMPPPPPARVPWRLGFGTQAQVQAGFVPEAAAAVGVFADLAQASSSLALSFRLSLYGAVAHATFADGVGADLFWFMGRVEGCPARLGPGWLFVTACLDVEAGVLSSHGTGLATEDQEGRPWVIPGALVRLAWTQSSSSWIEGSAGIGLPLERYAFHYDGPEGQVQAFRMPAVGSELGLAVGYRLP
jgi:hypothetical protein